MTQRHLIGFGAGLAGAILFASAAAGATPLGYLLFLLAPLPTFLAGLGWGWSAGAVAAATAAFIVGLVTGPWGAFIYVLTEGVPVVTLCYLVSLSRAQPAPPATGTPDVAGTGVPAALEWYPIGRVVIWAALMAGGLAVASLVVMGGSVDAIRDRLRPVVETFVTKQLSGLSERTFSPEDIDRLTEVAMHVMPAASAVLWLMVLLFNLWLAGRITLVSGNLVRPWPDLAATTYPDGTPLLLAAAVAATFLSGLPGLVASSFAGALYTVYVLLGLAIVHWTTRGVASRGVILFAAYAGLLILNTWMSLVFAVIGLLEPWAPWRRRWPPSGPHAGSPPPSGGPPQPPDVPG